MKKILPIIIAILVVGGAAFYGGTQYAKGKQPSNNFYRSSGGQFGGQTNGRGQGRAAGGFINGDIISKDSQSVTVKLRDGGSKIIFFSGTTKITKSVDGTADDLKAGATVMASGSANSDGSVTADTIQLRPGMPPSATAPAAK